MVDHYGPVFPAMACEVSLAVAVEVQAARHDASRDGLLPDAGVYNFALPFDVTWQPDVDRY